MKKALLFLSLFIALSYNTFGQKEHHRSKKPIYNKHKALSKSVWVSLNVTQVLKNMFNVRPFTIASDPFLLNGQFYWTDRWAVRLGSHMFLKNKTSTNESEANARILNGGIRLGIQKEQYLYKSFHFFYGLDIVGEASSDKSSFKGITRTIRTTLFGGGPLIGFGYQLGDRVRLSTESTYYFMTGVENNVLDIHGDKTTKRNNIFKLQHLVPNSLYVSIRI